MRDSIVEAMGGKLRALDKLKFSRHPDAIKLIEFCSQLAQTTLETIPIEALCLAAKVDPTTVTGALFLASRDLHKLETALITYEKHPEAVMATAFYAGLADGAKDREMMHKAVGWLPSPKGSNINLNFAPQPDDSEEDDNSPTDFNAVFGSDPMEIEQWGEARRKLLESGK